MRDGDVSGGLVYSTFDTPYIRIIFGKRHQELAFGENEHGAFAFKGSGQHWVDHISASLEDAEPGLDIIIWT